MRALCLGVLTGPILAGCADRACRTDAECAAPKVCVRVAPSSEATPDQGRCQQPCRSGTDCVFQGRWASSCRPLQGEGSTTHTMADHGARYNTVPTSAGIIKVCLPDRSTPAR